MKAGKEYELLIERLYRQLAPSATIVHDDHIFDDRAKITRQIDVSIKYKYAGVDHLIIVQAKDYKKKANIDVVDQFQQVIEDTNANKGILICAKGFSTAAINKAKSYGIECLTLYSAENKNWQRELQILTVREEHIFDFSHKVGFFMNFSGKKLAIPTIHIFSFDQGRTQKRIPEIIYDYGISKLPKKQVYSKKNIVVEIPGDIWYYYFGNWLKIKTLKVEFVLLKVLKYYQFFTPDRYLYTLDHIKNQISIHNANFQDLEYEIDLKDWKRFSDEKQLPIVSEKQTHKWVFTKFTDTMFRFCAGVDKIDNDNFIDIDLGLNKLNKEVMEKYANFKIDDM